MDSLYGSACGAYIYDEDVLDFLVKYDNNLAGEMQILQPDCRTIINSQFLVAYRSVYDAAGAALSADTLFRLGYDRIPKCLGIAGDWYWGSPDGAGVVAFGKRCAGRVY